MAARHGHRLRKGVVTAALTAATVAALSASQAPGITDTPQGRQSTRPTPPSGDSATDSPYYTDLPPLHTPDPPGDDDDGAGRGPAEAGIPATILDAYKKAEAALRETEPGCHLPWELLAAIGKVESGQARGGRVDGNGTTLTPILGPQLNGNGFARILDTDRGAYDSDSTHDRAVGPMQFIPSTWANWAQDGNGDGAKDPNNIYDAALAAGRYLCAGDRDLATTAGLHQAILSYNNSRHYLRTVLSWLEYYRKGVHEVPDGTGILPRNRSDERGTGATDAAEAGRAGDGRHDAPGSGPGSGPDSDRDPSQDSPEGTTSDLESGSSSASSPDAPDPSDPGTAPSDPSQPPTDGGSSSGGTSGGGSETPSPTPTPTPNPSPADRVTRLANASGGELTATAGTAFTTRPAVTARDGNGAGVAGVEVEFELVGETDSRFDGGATKVTASTGSTGKATAPALQAGEQTGEFTVRARVVGRSLPALDLPAQVTARQADTLTRVGDAELNSTADSAFADRVQVKATLKGAAASGVAVSATMVKSADAEATGDNVNDKGPYFKDTDGNAVRALKDLKTTADGTLNLPPIYADGTKGTYLLRLDAVGGGTLTLELKIS